NPYRVRRSRLDGVIAVVDAVTAAATLDAHTESVKQVAVADRIVLTKTDLLTTAEGRRDREALTARLHMLNPAAPVLDAAANEATPERLLACGLFDPARKHPNVKGWLAAEAYADADHRHHGHHPPAPPHRPQSATTTASARSPSPAKPRCRPPRSTCSSTCCARCTAPTCCASKAS